MFLLRPLAYPRQPLRLKISMIEAGGLQLLLPQFPEFLNIAEILGLTGVERRHAFGFGRRVRPHGRHNFLPARRKLGDRHALYIPLPTRTGVDNRVARFLEQAAVHAALEGTDTDLLMPYDVGKTPSGFCIGGQRLPAVLAQSGVGHHRVAVQVRIQVT
ncbi:MAG TPA: hypothetical protein VGM55_05685 [Cedecea sp.]